MKTLEKDTTYNGWTNRETWLVNLWFEFDSLDQLGGVKEQVREMFYEFDDLMIGKGFVSDFVASPDFDAIN